MEPWVSIEESRVLIRRSEQVAFRELAGEAGAVLLRLDNGQYHGLDSIGRLVWELIGEGITMENLVESLRDHVEDPPATLADEIEQFVDELAERGLVWLSPQP